MPYFKDEMVEREEFRAIKTARKILNEQRKEEAEKREQKEQVETEARKFVKALEQFLDESGLSRAVFLFKNGESLALTRTGFVWCEGEKGERLLDVLTFRDCELLLHLSGLEVTGVSEEEG